MRSSIWPWISEGAHAPCVHGDDLVVEVGPTRLVLADQLRIEAALAVPGDLDRQIAFVVLERLGGLAVATVAAVPAIGGMFLVAEMIGELKASRIRSAMRFFMRLSRPSSPKHGELTSVWVPDEEQEAIRDLERAREDFKHAERRVRQRLAGFLLRHGRNYTGGRRWTQAHYRWLEAPGIPSSISSSKRRSILLGGFLSLAIALPPFEQDTGYCQLHKTCYRLAGGVMWECRFN